MRLTSSTVVVGGRSAVSLARKLSASTALASGVIAGMLLFQPGAAQAQTVDWIGGTNDYNAAGNWNPATAPVVGGTAATFSGNGQSAVAVTGPITTDSWAISGAQAYALSGDAVTFATTAGVTNSSSATQTISNVLAGVGATLTQSGTGTLILSGANTYTGATTINAGTLQLGAAGVIADASALVINGGTLSLNGFAETVGGLSGTAGTIAVTAGSRLNVVQGADATYAGSMSGSVAGTVYFEKLGASTLTLTGTNTVTGAGRFEISAGRVIVSGGSAISDTSIIGLGAGRFLEVAAGQTETVGALTSGAGGEVVLNTGATLTIGGVGFAANVPSNLSVISGAGNLVLNAPALTQSFGASMTYTGTTTITNGTFLYTASDIIADASSVTLNGASGVLNIATFNDTVAGVSLLAGTIAGTTGVLTSTTAFDVQAGSVSAILGGAVGLTKTTAGTVTLLGVNTYTGATTINAGVLAINSTDALGSGAASNTLVFGGASTLQAQGTITSPTTRGVTLNAAATIDTNNNAVSIAGVVDGAGTLTKSGGGTLTLSGANTYTGATTVTAGSLLVTNAAGLGSAAAGTTVQSGAALQLQGGIVIGAEALSLAGTGVANDGALRNIAGANSYGGAITLAAASRVNSDAGSLTLAGGLAGGGFDLAMNTVGGITITTADATNIGILTKTGAGTLTIGAGRTLSAATISNTAGTIAVGAGSTLQGTGNTLNNSATIDVGQNGVVTDAGNINNAVGGIINFNGPGPSLATLASTTNGVIDNLGTINVNAGLDAANLNRVNLVGSGTGLSVTGTGTINLFNFSGLRAGSVNQSIANTLAGQANSATTIDNNANALTIGGQITGVTTSTVNFIGAGLTTLSGVNAAGAATEFAGTANVTTGVVEIGGTFGNPGTNSATVNVANAATLQGAGTIAGNLAVAAGGIFRPGDTGTAPSEAGGFTVNGNLTLAATSRTFFDLNTTQTIGGATNDLVTVGGTLAVTAGAQLDVTPAVTGYYRLMNVGAGAASATGFNNNITLGGVAAGAGAAEVYAVGTTQVNLRLVNGGQSLQAWDGTDTTGAATVGGGGGTGNWTDAGTNWTENPSGVINDRWREGVAFFGGTAGTVTVVNPKNVQGVQFGTTGYVITGDALNLTGNPFAVAPTNTNASFFNVDAGVTAQIDSVITSAANIGLDKIGTGTLILTGANTYSGLTDVQAGVLNIRNNTALGAGTGVAADGTRVRTGAALEMQGGITVANEALFLNGTGVGGAGALRNISGNNAWNGPITLETNSQINTDAGVLTLGGVISGAATLTKDGAGTLTLNGVNTYSGVTTVAGGFLINNGTIAGSLSNAATTTNNGTIGGGLTNTAGTFTNAGIVAGASTISAGAVANSGAFQSTLGLTGGTFTNGAGGTVAGTTTNNGGVVTNNGGSFAAVNNQAGTFANTTGTAGAVTNAATGSNGGTIASLANTAGTFTNAGIVAGPSTISAGAVANSGAFQSTLGLTGGTFTNGAGGTVAGTTTNNGGGVTNNGGSFAAVNNQAGTFANTAGTAGAVTNAATGSNGGTIALLANTAGTFGNTGTISGGAAISGGVFTTSGIVNGGLANAARTNASGTISGGVVNSGSFVVSGALNNGGGDFTNNTPGTLSFAGAFAFSGIGTLTNNAVGTNAVVVPAGASLSAAAIRNLAGTFTNAGSVVAPSVTNAAGATFINSGTLLAASTNSFTNAGTTTNTGSLTTGRLVNSGTLNSSNLLTVTTDFANSGTFNGSGTLNSATVTNSGFFNVVGNLGGTIGTFSNLSSGRVDLTGGNLTGIGAFNNAGLVNATFGSRTLGASTFTNQSTGVVNLARNGSTSDVLSITGSYVGLAGSQIVSDIDLSRLDTASSRGDRVIVSGQASGATSLSFNIVNNNRVAFTAPIDVFTVAPGSGITVNQGEIDRRGFFGYFLRESSAGSGAYQVVSQFNSGPVAGVLSGVNGVIASLQSGFHQPASAIVSRPDSCTPNQLMGGPFIRMNRGETMVKNNSSGDLTGGGAPFTGNSKSTGDFSGFQGGFDLGVCNINGSGWNVNAGVMGGYVSTSSSSLSTSPSPVAGGAPSVTRVIADVDTPFYGLYSFITNGPFTAELNLRKDLYDTKVTAFDPTNGSVYVGPKTKLQGSGLIFNAAMQYRFSIDRFYVEPQIGISRGQTKFGALGFTTSLSDGLVFRDSQSVLGRVGVNVGTAVQATDNLVLVPFGHVSVWREFERSSEAQAVFNSVGQTFDVSTDRVGTFGQVGAGVQFRLLNSPWLGFLRADVRFGEKTEGKALNGGVRVQF